MEARVPWPNHWANSCISFSERELVAGNGSRLSPTVVRLAVIRAVAATTPISTKAPSATAKGVSIPKEKMIPRVATIHGRASPNGNEVSPGGKKVSAMVDIWLVKSSWPWVMPS
jgi:hypothetical protein